MEQVPQPTLNIKQEASKTRQKIKFFFRKNTHWKCTQLSNLASINKCKPKMLSFLDITNIRFQDLSSKGFKDLYRALTGTKMVHSLILEDTDLNPKQLAYLLNLMKNSRRFRFLDYTKQPQLNQKPVQSLMRLTRCKNFTDLPIPMVWTQDINKKTLSRFYRQLRGLNKLKILSLDIPFCNSSDILSYRPPRSLNSLNILLRKNVDQQLLGVFASNIQGSCLQLKNISLVIGREYKIKPEDAHIWSEIIQNLKSLQDLGLIIDFHSDQEFKEIQTFLNSFPRFQHLTALDLDFSHTWPANQSLQFIDSFFIAFFDNIKSLTQLEKLKLKLKSFPNMKNTHLHQFILALQHLKNLKHLTLKLPCIESPNEPILSLFQTLQNLTELQVLDLGFLDTSLSRTDLEAFFNKTPSKNLTSLKLTLGHPPLKFKNIFSTFSAMEFGAEKITSLWTGKQVSLFSGISRFNQLSNLHLELMRFNISIQDYKQLSLVLTGLHQLSSLALTFPRFDSTNNSEGLRNLTSCFKDIINLTTLDLSFKGLNVRDQEMDIVGSGLMDCKKLETLKLIVSLADKLTEKSLGYLLAGISGLKETLKFLLLEFHLRKEFEERPLIELLEGLIVLKDLEYFKFVDDSASRGRQVRANLPDGLKEYQNLKHLRKFLINNCRFV